MLTNANTNTQLLKTLLLLLTTVYKHQMSHKVLCQFQFPAALKDVYELPLLIFMNRDKHGVVVTKGTGIEDWLFVERYETHL
jgi:hypothetical protein